jgi:hypothetical protein
MRKTDKLKKLYYILMNVGTLLENKTGLEDSYWQEGHSGSGDDEYRLNSSW